MRRDLEALLFASDQPLSLARLATIFPSQEKAELRKSIEDLQQEYEKDEHAFMIVEFGGGYSISTRQEFAPIVGKLFRGRRKARLSKAALECLAIISYKQPVTRLEIEEIRGVSVSGVIATLLERDLINIVGRADSLGHPLLYGSTRTFLEYMGLRNLSELPQLSELEDLLSQREEIKHMASEAGADINDEEIDAAAGIGVEEEIPDGEMPEETVADSQTDNDPVSVQHAADESAEDAGIEDEHQN